MSDVVVASFVPPDAGNVIAVAIVDDAGVGKFDLTIGQFTDASPSVAYASLSPTTDAGDLWCAFRGNANTSIYVAASSNWGDNLPTGQSSNLAPSLAIFEDSLWIAYVGRGSGHIEVISSPNGKTWSTWISTGQKSNLAPALTIYGDILWVAYVGEGSGHVELVTLVDSGEAWSTPIDTGMPSQSAPSLAAVPADLILL